MTLNETLKQLKALGNEKMRAHNTRYGAGDNQFGVKHGDIRVLAKKIKNDDKLAMSLWETGNADAQLLAALLIKPKNLSAKEVDLLVRSIAFAHVADWLINYVVSSTPRRKRFVRSGWPVTTVGPHAPAGASLPSGSSRARKDSTPQRCWIASKQRWETRIR